MAPFDIGEETPAREVAGPRRRAPRWSAAGVLVCGGLAVATLSQAAPGRAVGLAPRVGGYDPCSGRLDGLICRVCAPADPSCAETDTLRSCAYGGYVVQTSRLPPGVGTRRPSYSGGMPVAFLPPLPIAGGRTLPHAAQAARVPPRAPSGSTGRAPRPLWGVSMAAADATTPLKPRNAIAIDKWPGIPVWPTWAGGRVVPMSPNPYASDPFLLLAHHKHSFTPWDPLRQIFKAVGGALGLPYVGDEGFAFHPHRGTDILTYILDGSDGFRHTDSLGGNATYRGGSAQFMRTGHGVFHEEMWETNNDRTTRIELFQLWMNLPGRQKLQPPAIRYLGRDWGAPFPEEDVVDGNGITTKVRIVLDESLLLAATEGEGELVGRRPPVLLLHAWLQPGATWTSRVEPGHTAWLYVREGSVGSSLGSSSSSATDGVVNARSTALFDKTGNAIVLKNPSDSSVADVLLLSGAPLLEPVAFGGPIVMNTNAELQQAYQELRDGSFTRSPETTPA